MAQANETQGRDKRKYDKIDVCVFDEDMEQPAKRRRVDQEIKEIKEPSVETSPVSDHVSGHDMLRKLVNNGMARIANDFRLRSEPGGVLQRLERLLSVSRGIISDAFIMDAVNSKLGFSIPTDEVLSRVQKFLDGTQAVSVGCGLGLLDYLLKDRGVSVTSTDAGLSHGAEADDHKPFVSDVQKMFAEDAVNRYVRPGDSLIISWPPHNTPMASDALLAFLERNGTRVVYVRGCAGLTGDARFHELLNEHFDLEFEMEGLSFCRSYNDMTQGYTRKALKPAWAVPAINWNSLAFNTFRE